jgi:hypothetical protein
MEAMLNTTDGVNPIKATLLRGQYMAWERVESVEVVVEGIPGDPGVWVRCVPCLLRRFRIKYFDPSCRGTLATWSGLTRQSRSPKYGGR